MQSTETTYCQIDSQARIVLLEHFTDFERFFLVEGVEKGVVRGCGSYAEVYDGMLSTRNVKKRIAIKRIRVILYKETKDFVKVRHRPPVTKKRTK
jgi:hypothetical protein